MIIKPEHSIFIFEVYTPSYDGNDDDCEQLNSPLSKQEKKFEAKIDKLELYSVHLSISIVYESKILQLEKDKFTV